MNLTNELKKVLFEYGEGYLLEEVVDICENYALEMLNNREKDIKEMLIKEDLKWLSEAIIITK